MTERPALTDLRGAPVGGSEPVKLTWEELEILL